MATVASQAIYTGEIALELHAFFRELDATRFRAGIDAKLMSRLDEIRARFDAVRRADWPTGGMPALRQRLDDLYGILEEASPRGRKQWKELHRRAQPAYEALAVALRESAVHVPSLRPTNYLRNAAHVFNACLTLVVAHVLLSTMGQRLAVTASVAAVCWALEIGRRIWPELNDRLMQFFRHTAHPLERFRVNSATWFATALALMGLHGSLLVGAIAVAVLGVGDPAAAAFGRRFGRIELIHGRTLEGSLAFVVAAGTLASLTVLVWHAYVGLVGGAVIVGLATIGGALAELFARRVDDNLAVPMGAAIGAAIGASIMGVPLWG